MSPTKPTLDRVVPVLRRVGSRVRAGHAVALSVVAAAAFGLAGLRAIDLPAHRPIDDNDRLRIEVVHPVEPEIVPGSVMEVGELVDGFQGLPPPLPPLTDAGWSYDVGWDDAGAWAPPSAEARPAAEARPWEFRPEADRPSAVRVVQRWFGFDEPRRDFQAERAARRARMEATERDARERYAAERFRRERIEDDRYAEARGRDEARSAPRWRDDRVRESEDDRPFPYAPPEAAFDYIAAQPPGPRPYTDVGR